MQSWDHEKLCLSQWKKDINLSRYIRLYLNIYADTNYIICFRKHLSKSKAENQMVMRCTTGLQVTFPNTSIIISPLTLAGLYRSYPWAVHRLCQERAALCSICQPVSYLAPSTFSALRNKMFHGHYHLSPDEHTICFNVCWQQNSHDSSPYLF